MRLPTMPLMMRTMAQVLVDGVERKESATMRRTLLPLVLLIVLLPAIPVAAHGMSITYTLAPVVALRVDLAVYDANGDPLNDVQLTVLAPDAADPWIDTALGKKAVFSFVPDVQRPGAWTVTLRTDDASATLNLPLSFSMGHASVAEGEAVTLAAHGMTVSTTLTAIITAQVTLAAEFDGGDPLDEGQVNVYAPDNAKTPWLTGTCDADGRYTFVADVTNAGRWEIQVRQAGHGDWLRITLDADTVTMEPDDGTHATTLRIADSVASGSSDNGKLSTGQIALMAVCVIWGMVGTAFYFARRKQDKDSQGNGD